MAKYLFASFAFLAVAFVSGRDTGPTCTLNQETLEKSMISCMSHNPSLMIQIMEIMQNPQATPHMDFLCSKPKDILDLILCMQDKLVSCYPDVKNLIPTKERWQTGLKFICDHKTELLEDRCMQGQYQDFVQCYANKLATLPIPTPDAIQSAVCSVIRAEEGCIQAHHGTCSQTVVDLVIQMLEKFFDVSKCPAAVVDTKEQAMNNVLGSILIHGQPQGLGLGKPLYYQPKGEAQYNIMQGL